MTKKAFDKLERKFKKESIEILAEWGKEIQEQYPDLTVGEPYDLSDENVRSWLTIERRNENDKDYDENSDKLDITLELIDAKTMGDADKEHEEINISCMIVEYGGSIIGGIIPGNYSDECWFPVNDVEEYEERMEGMRNAYIMGTIEDWIKEK